MPIVSETFNEHEIPTVPRPHVPERTLVALRKIERAALLASEKLTIQPDADAVLSAIFDLAAICDLAREAGR